MGVPTAGAAAGPAPLLTEPACENVTTPPGRLQTVCALLCVAAFWAIVFACEVLILQTAPATDEAWSRLAFCRILTLPMARSTALLALGGAAPQSKKQETKKMKPGGKVARVVEGID